VIALVGLDCFYLFLPALQFKGMSQIFLYTSFAEAAADPHNLQGFKSLL